MRRLLLPLLALVMGLSLVNAAPAAAGDIASTIRDRYASLNTFQAEFTQYLKHRESGQQEKRQGTLIFKKPLLVNWQTRAPHAESLIISADEIWDYLPEEKVAYRYPHSLVDDSRSLIQIVTGQALLSKDFDVKDGGTQGALQILRLYPKNPSPQMIQADLYVDPVKGYIQRAEIIDFYGNSNDVRFTSFIPDADVSSSSFRFKAPSGVDVEDKSKPDQGGSRLLN